MRVIAGTLGGRQFRAPKGNHTHPMSEKARGGLFNLLGDLSGLRVLDTFSGSGALAYEAISRGADEALLIENDKQAIRAIQENIHSLQIEQHCKLIAMGVSSWAQNNEDMFDIVFADPPYDKLQFSAIAMVATHVKKQGLLVVSVPSATLSPELDGLTIVEERKYGDAKLVFYRKID